MALARNESSIGNEDPAILCWELEKKEEHFDIEYFMKSTDVGLYNVAKKIFSYACQRPRDLVGFQKVNKTFNEFIKKEEDSLLNKFEKVNLFVDEKYISRILSAQKYLEDSYDVSVMIHPKDKIKEPKSSQILLAFCSKERKEERERVLLKVSNFAQIEVPQML